MELILDFQLYYVECGTEFTNSFGDIDMKFYDSMCSVYYTVIQTVNNYKDDSLYRKYEKRLYGIVHDTGGIGWGYHDYVTEEFFTISWRKE